MNQLLLQELHKAELGALIEIDRLCRKNNITYFLSCGTLLGAVRHKGFIPWDEDLDVSMPREDYERFLDVAKNELDERYLLDCYSENKQYFNPFAKIRIRNSLFAIEALRDYKGHQGIWVDIFPMDYVKDTDLTSTKLRAKLIQICRIVICAHRDIFDWSKVASFKKLIFRAIALFPDKMFWSLMEKLHKAGSKHKNHFVIFGTDYNYKKLIFPVDDFCPPKETPFEGNLFQAPAQCDRVLTKIYGDYMTVPPKEEQVTFYPMNVMLEDVVLYDGNDVTNNELDEKEVI